MSPSRSSFSGAREISQDPNQENDDEINVRTSEKVQDIQRCHMEHFQENILCLRVSESTELRLRNCKTFSDG